MAVATNSIPAPAWRLLRAAGPCHVLTSAEFLVLAGDAHPIAVRPAEPILAALSGAGRHARVLRQYDVGVLPRVPQGLLAGVHLRGRGRFYGTADLISLCQGRGWNYRLRLKGTLTVRDRSGRTTTAARAKGEIRYLEDVELTARRAKTHIGIIRDPGHDQPWRGTHPG